MQEHSPVGATINDTFNVAVEVYGTPLRKENLQDQTG